MFLMASCGSDFSEFKQMALDNIKSDGRIDSIKYARIKNFIKNSNDKSFSIFKNDDKIDDEKVKSYLITYFTTQKIVFSPNDINIPVNNNLASKFNVNVFIENSASMDGYVVGKTDFENAIYNLLVDFKINSNYCDSLNLNYINKKVFPNSINAKPEEISNFIEKLEPSNFQKRGGDRTSTDISDVFKTILDQTNDKSVSVLISDFVFSPGKNYDAVNYLNHQSSTIKLQFATKLKTINLSSIVIQLESEFNGTYFDKFDHPHQQLNAIRPYYIWLIGKKENIELIYKSKILDNLQGSLNKFVFELPNENKSPSFQILHEKKVGDFSVNNSGVKEISNISLIKDDKTKFGFSIAVDFSNSIQDEKYYTDKSNFIISNSNYNLNCDIISSSKKNDPTLNSYSHIINLKAASVISEILKIKVLGKIPSWVVKSSSLDDTRIELNQDNEKSKTFGLEYLIDGIKKAYYPDTTKNILNTLSISIKK
jgi:hypothetical protein